MKAYNKKPGASLSASQQGHLHHNHHEKQPPPRRRSSKPPLLPTRAELGDNSRTIDGNGDACRTRFIVDRSQSSSSFCYKSILASRSVPILFILVCFLVIANTNCDHASSTNDAPEQSLVKPLSVLGETASELVAQNDRDVEAADTDEQQAAISVNIKSSSSSSSAPTTKGFPYYMREIYLDGSKLTMLLPDDPGLVQKFHPNGRYGRRSVDYFAEQHNELGKLVPGYQSANSFYRAPSSPAAVNSGASIVTSGDAKSLIEMLRAGGRSLDAARAAAARLNLNASRGGGGDGDGATVKMAPLHRQHDKAEPATTAAATTGLVAQRPSEWLVESRDGSTTGGANYRTEMSKLLRCNYSGVSNLYWCDANSAAALENK